MKKILVAFDGNNFSEGALEFVRQLNEKSPVLLTAAFLPQIDYANLWSYSGGGRSADAFIPLMEDEDAAAVSQLIHRVQDFCTRHHIEHRVHKDFFDLAIPALKKETRFADMLIISSTTFYEQTGAGVPNEYLKEMLHGTECPVIVVPEEFAFPASNVLTYDGSESSVYAIKQFAYLFPELAANETLLIYIKAEEDKTFPEQENIEELAARHFSNLTLLKLDMDPGQYLITWLLERKGAIMVSGAYGRSGFSRLFKKSFMTEVIRDKQIPVFIAHT